MATNFRDKIGKIGRLILIRRLGIPKRIAISPFCFFNVYLRWLGYIEYTWSW